MVILTGIGSVAFRFRSVSHPPVSPELLGPPTSELNLDKNVIVTTDKTTYKRGEVIKIPIKNNSTKIICSNAPTGNPVFSIVRVERKKPDGNWEYLFAQCQYPYCIYKIHFPQEIKPGSSVAFEWEPFIYIGGTTKRTHIISGVYRILTTHRYVDEDCFSPEGEWRYSYSNLFTIK